MDRSIGPCVAKRAAKRPPRAAVQRKVFLVSSTSFINALANARGIIVIEDNAHGLFGKYKGKPLGTLGAMATQSFHETKNITCGEGGALVLNDPAFIESAEIIREKGCLLYTSPSPRDYAASRMPSSA